MTMAKTKAVRKARQRELAAERAALAEQFNVKTPNHMRNRLGLGSKIGDALSVTGTLYNWDGLNFTEETGEAYLTPPSAEVTANVVRKEEATSRAQDLRRKYMKLWNIRGGAKRIAAEEGIGLSTVYAHMARLRRT